MSKDAATIVDDVIDKVLQEANQASDDEDVLAVIRTQAEELAPGDHEMLLDFLRPVGLASTASP